MENVLVNGFIGLFGALVLLGIILGSVMVSGFRKNAIADRVIAERISMQMAESSGLMKEMALTTIEMARKTDEMRLENQAWYKEYTTWHKEHALFLRMILERVDKNR